MKQEKRLRLHKTIFRREYLCPQRYPDQPQLKIQIWINQEKEKQLNEARGNTSAAGKNKRTGRSTDTGRAASSGGKRISLKTSHQQTNKNPANNSQGRRSSQARLNFQKIEPVDNVSKENKSKINHSLCTQNRRDGNIQRK